MRWLIPLVVAPAVSACGIFDPGEETLIVAGRLSVDARPVRWLIDVGTYIDPPDGYINPGQMQRHVESGSDTNGVYRIEARLPAERCLYIWIYFRSPDSTLMFEEMTLRECGDHPGLDLDLAAEVLDVSGTLRSGGVPVGGAMVSVETYPDHIPHTPRVSTVSASDGTYRIRTLVSSALCDVLLVTRHPDGFPIVGASLPGCGGGTHLRDVAFGP
jgi:hypothetical protein